MVVDNGRTFLSDTSFIPRLIVHEFIHAWKGRYLFTSDSDWNYDPPLSGFEEATAEGMAFEIIHEYVRSYPNDVATIQLLDLRPYQYWSNFTTCYDSIKNNRWTGAGNFGTHSSGHTYLRYSIAATTVQMMVKENPLFYKEVMNRYFSTINSDENWRVNREDLLDIWTEVVPEIHEHDTKEYIDAMPVFQGHKLDEGMYVLNLVRPYGGIGDQQFTASYVPKNGSVWWGVPKTEVNDFNLPDWVNWVPGTDLYVYIDMLDEPFTIDLYDAFSSLLNTYNYRTEIVVYPNGVPAGLGWKMTNDIAMENIPLGLYKETVTFDNYIPYDSGASEDFYIFGYDGLNQDRYSEYVLMIGIDGVSDGNMAIIIEGQEYTEPIVNGVAIFRSLVWPFDMECEFPINVFDTCGNSHTYYRTIL
jgi:hypothetical protein